MKLKGKGAIVTGAGSGIGLAIARLFADEGASVLVAELDEDAGQAAARQINDAGGEARYLRTDTAREEDVKAAIASAMDA